MPSQTAARFSSRTTSGIAEFGRAGPLDVRFDGRRPWPLPSPSVPAASCRRGPTRSAWNQLSGLNICGRAVEGEGDELGAAADILPRHRSAEAVLGRSEAEAAVGAAVAIVAHQEQMAGRNA